LPIIFGQLPGIEIMSNLETVFESIIHFALKDPRQTELGRSIVKNGINMIADLGFEEMNFKKLGKAIGSPEASIYRYFENKHKFLLYIMAMYWGMIDQHCEKIIHSNNGHEEKIYSILDLLCSSPDIPFGNATISGEVIYAIVIGESVKTFMTKHVDADNNHGAFRTLKSTTSHIAELLSEYSPDYPFPKALASTIIEMSLYQRYFSEHLPSMTDIGKHQSIVVDLKQWIIGLLRATRITSGEESQILRISL
jgi:AcrR family transcriptional regulator